MGFQTPQTRGDGREPAVQLQPARVQRRAPVVGQRAADRRAVPAHHLGLRAGPPLRLAFDIPHPAHRLLEFLLGVPIRLINRAGGLAPVVELAQLVRHTGKHLGHRLADRVLAVGHDPDNRHRAARLHRAQQLHEVLLPGRQQALREEDLAAEYVPKHPQHLVPDIGLKPVEGQDHLLLGGEESS